MKTKIETATTIAEFRSNLLKYFASQKRSIYVQHHNRCEYISVDSLSSFDDIYRVTKTGWYGNMETVCVVPLVKYNENELMNCFTKHPNGYIAGCIEFFSAEENYKLYPSLLKFKGKAKWASLDNQIYRGFFIKVVGDFSGYGYYNSKNVA